MDKVLVFVEHHSGQIKRSSQEILSAAKAHGKEVHALALGAGTASLKDQAGKFGASQLHVFADSKADGYNSEIFTAAVVQVLKEVSPQLVLAAASSTGKDLWPRVSAKMDAALATDCVGLKISGTTVEVRRPVYSGKCFMNASLENSSLKIVTMRPNQLPVSESAVSCSVKEHALPSLSLKTILENVVRGTSEKLDLTEANIIVSGGRGMKEAGNFKLLNDLADVLGATVGASRAVVDAGWVPHEMQVGQTGKTVAPSLYIAVGISGAIQHLAGMSGSKVIVAINNDSNAPIFQKATYGIVGDFAEVIPALTEEFRKVLK